MTLTSNTNNTDNVVLNNTVGTGLTMLQAVNDEFTGTSFTSKFTKSSLTFETDSISTDIKLLGTPTLNLDYQSNVNLCQYNFQIYEVSKTKAKLITRINYTDRSYTANQRRTKAITGMSHGHVFSAGNKIRIVVTNLDTAPDDLPFLATNPHVLPVLKNGKHKMYLSNNCYITFPVKNYTARPRLSITGETEGENSTVKTYALNQNYPNPFNPVTMISYQIPLSGLVTLKVYDLTGREIAVLVNGVENSGQHQIQFNIDRYGLSSGVYFYKLTSGSYTEVKKMMVIK